MPRKSCPVEQVGRVGSNAFLWPATLAGWLEGLSERAEWLIFYWIMLGPCVLCWDFVLKDEVEP